MVIDGFIFYVLLISIVISIIYAVNSKIYKNLKNRHPLLI